MDLFAVLAAITGLIGGLVLNQLADVLPHDKSPRQPVCQNEACLKSYSWAEFLRFARCPHCGQRRSLRSLWMPLGLAAFSLYLWLKAGSPLMFGLDLLVLFYLTLVAVIDLEHRLVLRILSLPGLLLCAAIGFFVRGWQGSLLGGLGGFAIMMAFYLLGIVFTKIRARRMGNEQADGEEALGSGDVTLATLLGLLLGWPLIWFNLLMGILFSGVISLLIIAILLLRRQYLQQAMNVFIPLGPFFIASTLLLLHFPTWVKAALP